MHKTITTADARKNFADIVNTVAYGKEPIVLTRRGQEIAALISIEELQLLQRIEDHIDIEDAKKALEEPGENISADEFWKELGL
ncbi:MAG: type II toxin-antitoxin system Phd/YefM family antitoxin [Desulfopila sp.]|jgi:prevent-host-death family protein|nr:type II toxin-antitoxin system Phd/YefM family antitoxin [Desulfopila sp.]